MIDWKSEFWYWSEFNVIKFQFSLIAELSESLNFTNKKKNFINKSGKINELGFFDKNFCFNNERTYFLNPFNYGLIGIIQKILGLNYLWFGRIVFSVYESKAINSVY